ncbi:MAG: hypothetical protein H6713_30615 [Myxococcales bacterium]|nr:hypothetical protein [Myxococcales bacterium]
MDRRSSLGRHALAFSRTLALVIASASCGGRSAAPEVPPARAPTPSPAPEGGAAPSDAPAPANRNEETSPPPPRPDPAEAPADALETPDDPCVADCLRRSQMRAIAWEQIQRDCAAECEGAQERVDQGSG